MRLYYWSQLSPTFQKSGKFAHVSIIFSSGCSSGGKPIWVAFYSSRTRRHRFPSLFFLHDWFVQIDESSFSRHYRVVSTMVAFLFLLTTQWSHQILLCSLQMAGFQKYLLMVFYYPTWCAGLKLGKRFAYQSLAITQRLGRFANCRIDAKYWCLIFL